MIYLLSPYTHDDVIVKFQRFKAACEAVATLRKRGLDVFSPIVHNHPVWYYMDGAPSDYNSCRKWSDQLLMMCRAGIVLCIDGWRESVGIKSETSLLVGNSKRVLYMEHPGAFDLYDEPIFSGRTTDYRLHED